MLRKNPRYFAEAFAPENLSEQIGDSAYFEKHAAIRTVARETFIQAESSTRFRALAAARSMPVREFREGMLIYYWRVKFMREPAGTHKLRGVQRPRTSAGFGTPGRGIFSWRATIHLAWTWWALGPSFLGQVRAATRMEMELQASVGNDRIFPSFHDMSAIERLLSQENMSQWEDLTGSEHQIPAEFIEEGTAEELAERMDVPDGRFFFQATHLVILS